MIVFILFYFVLLINKIIQHDLHDGSEVIPYLNLLSAPLTFFVMQSMQITALTHAKGEENKE